jgi:hypothetical protein
MDSGRQQGLGSPGAPKAALNATNRRQYLTDASSTLVPGGVGRLLHKEAPSTPLKQSPLEDMFVLRAAEGDFEDVIRRLARGQVRGNHACCTPWGANGGSG